MRRQDVTRRLVWVVALAVAAATCIDPLDARPFGVAIESNRLAAAVGDTLTFVVTAQGENLLGILTDYADGTVDSFATGGATTAHVIFLHAFQAAGTYDVRASVTDGVAGQKDASLQVQVH